MLRIGKLTDYAFIIMGFLAENASEIRSAAWIAMHSRLSLPTVSKLLKILAEAGLVTSSRGQGGGYQLAKNASDVTVAEIVSAIEGSLALTECCTATNSCAIDAHCTIKENWRTINKMIFSVLAGFTLRDMIRPLAKQTMTLRGIPVTVKGMMHE